jgi:hypothetical protein
MTRPESGGRPTRPGGRGRPTRPGGFQQYAKTIPVEGGIKAQSTRGAIGESWWSQRFIAVLESFDMGTRLARGRNYARKGQVLRLDVSPGLVSSSVQGSRPSPYRVQIKVNPYDRPTWTRIERAMASQALFLARLLAGEMPAPDRGSLRGSRFPALPRAGERPRHVLLVSGLGIAVQAHCGHLLSAGRAIRRRPVRDPALAGPRSRDSTDESAHPSRRH